MTRTTSAPPNPSKRSRIEPGATDKHAPSTDAARIKVARANLAAAPHLSRDQLIAEAAYHRAESRGFGPGHELEDWLIAETEVEARLQGEGRAY